LAKASRCEAACRTPGLNGFTLIEAMIVLVIVATVIGALTPSVMQQIAHARANRAANVAAAILLEAQTLAGRGRTPVVVSFDQTAKTIRIALPAPASTVLSTRRFGLDSEFKLTVFTATQASITVRPNGTANTSVTITLGGGGLTRQVRMTIAGQVRML
jgi:prepilin-type N-terminal cleavage/methylation domain-containing protein